ncbi:hypothetical protein [Pedobacter ginsengisoli]|nr:hypothetical protein [Pedobacter ginsengisoli]
MKLKERVLHINKAISIVLLMVFSIALTPFSILHNHHEEETQCAKNGETCKHEFHVRKHAETCLICAAHFEKDYIKTHSHYALYQVSKPGIKPIDPVSNSYADLISLGLRGPPIA